MTDIVEQLKHETEKRSRTEPGSSMWIFQSERIEQLLDQLLLELKDEQ